MRILHLLASPVFSGPAENVALLALAQRALGHQVSVAVDRKRPGLADEEPLVPRLRALGLLDDGGLELSVKSWPWAMLSDVLTLRRREVDVVHSHFSHDHFVARLGRPAGAVLVRSVHAPRSLAGLPAADAYTAPSDRDAHALPAAPKIVLRALLGDEFRPALDRDSLRAELGLGGGPLIGMVSHFQPSRRHELGLRAFAALTRSSPGARLVLVGDGPLRARLQGAASDLGITDRVTFAGYRGGADFVRSLQALDVVWILGLGNDFTARAARQARACGVRVIGVDEGALPSWSDVTVPLTEEAIAVATTDAARRDAPEVSNEQIAREVLALYEEARDRRQKR